jgi:hypothetical protein
LDDAEAVATVGDIGEEGDVGDPELDVVSVADLAVSVVDLVDRSRLGAGDVKDRQPRAAGGDVGIGPR